MIRLVQFLRLNCARRNPRQGMSLIDVLLAMVILLIAIASSMALAVQLARTVQTDERITAAANLADYKLEELRNQAYANIIDGSDAGTLDSTGNSPGEFSRSWTVDTDSPDLGLKTVTITVTWTQTSGQETYELVGVVAQ